MHSFSVCKSRFVMVCWELSLITIFWEIEQLNLFWPMLHQDLSHTIITFGWKIGPSSRVTIVQTGGIFTFTSFQILILEDFIWFIFNIQIMFFKLFFDLWDCRKNCRLSISLRLILWTTFISVLWTKILQKGAFLLFLFFFLFSLPFMILCPRIFSYLALCHINRKMILQLLWSQGYVVEFSLEFLQCNFILP
jgi:hypothetical protein